MNEAGWTIDELAQQAAEVLAGCGVRAPNGRVTKSPDRRVIRWYATIGLLDRPLRTGGRTARYGSRHLLQLVAVKRRQAQGRSLAEIQGELTGATDTTLRKVAGLPGPANDTTLRQAAGLPAPANDVLREAAGLPTPAAPVALSALAGSRSWSTDAPIEATNDQDRREFWRERPVPAVDTVPPADPEPVDTMPPADPEPVDTVPPADSEPASTMALRYAVDLHPAASLTLQAPPDPDDLIAIQTAARPLLELLARRGLLTHPRRPR